jgi:hypothetical protein
MGPNENNHAKVVGEDQDFSFNDKQQPARSNEIRKILDDIT